MTYTPATLRAALRAELAAESTPEYAGVPAPVRAAIARPDVAPGPAVERPGQTRRTRLALPPAVRSKLEKIEARAGAAHSELLRLADLLADERARLTQLDRREQAWRENYFHGVDQGDVAALQAERTASADETARLTAQRATAETRWQGLSRLAENCREFLHLPRDGRRG